MGKQIITPVESAEPQDDLFESLFKIEIREEIYLLKERICRLELRLDDPFG